jgi:enoyl-[acyl-carrier protein] reductase I
MAVPIDLSGKKAFVTGVADNVGFGWHIASALQAAGAEIYLGCHPRVVGIVSRFLSGDKYADSRKLPFGIEGSFAPKAVYGCDVGYDVEADIPEDVRAGKGFKDAGDVSIAGCVERLKEEAGGVDIVIHSVAFSPEIAKTHLETSRDAYLTAMSISSYSLVALTRSLLPLMEGRGGSIVGLSYMASQRVVPFYGGGMASAKAALECDARIMAHFAGEAGHRVNIVSPGPYASRAARSIGDMGTFVDEVKERSPLKRAIDANDVANTVLWLCSDLARNVTGTCTYVDAGFHAMGM